MNETPDTWHVTGSRVIPLPTQWYLGAHGDPIATFDNVVLILHPNGGITWRQFDDP